MQPASRRVYRHMAKRAFTFRSSDKTADIENYFMPSFVSLAPTGGNPRHPERLRNHHDAHGII